MLTLQGVLEGLTDPGMPGLQLPPPVQKLVSLGCRGLGGHPASSPPLCGRIIAKVACTYHVDTMHAYAYTSRHHECTPRTVREDTWSKQPHRQRDSTHASGA